MKTVLVSLIALSGVTALTAAPLPTFVPGHVGLPPLSLRDSTAAQPKFDPGPSRAVQGPVAPIPDKQRADRFIFPPPAGADYKLLIARPDPDVEYHLRVIDPSSPRAK